MHTYMISIVLSYLSGNNIDTTDHFCAPSSVLHNSVWIYSYHKRQTEYSFLSHLKQRNIHFYSYRTKAEIDNISGSNVSSNSETVC
jgi:hypothetical protein